MKDQKPPVNDLFAERVKQKQASREEDERMLRDGEITREELQRQNGGFGIFRNSKLVRKK